MLLFFQLKLVTFNRKWTSEEGNISLLTGEHDIAWEISMYVDASTQNRIKIIFYHQNKMEQHRKRITNFSEERNKDCR